MAEGTVADRVIRVFADFKKVDPSEIKLETTFEELGLDSLDGLNLIFELEDEFDLMVPDDRVREMKSVREAVEGIQYLIDHPEAQPQNAARSAADAAGQPPAADAEPQKNPE